MLALIHAEKKIQVGGIRQKVLKVERIVNRPDSCSNV